MTSHGIKCWPELFAAFQGNARLFDLRKNDRDYQVGDWLKIREWEPPSIAEATRGRYTGARLLRRISYVLDWRDAKRYGAFGGEPPIAKGYVVLGLQPPISELGARLKGHRLFIEGTNKRHVKEATDYLQRLAALVQRLQDEAKAEARRKDRR